MWYVAFFLQFFEEAYFCHLRAYLLVCFYEKHLKFHISHLSSLRRFRTVETIPICKSRDGGTVKPQEIPIKICVTFYNRNLLLRLWIKNKFSCNHLIQKQPPEMFFKKAVLFNFAKFTGKHLCQSLFLNKVAALMPATLFKKRLWHDVFLCLLRNF